jgi:hypothetical protein
VHVRRQHRSSLITIQIDDEGGVPKTLVERAAAIKRRTRREALRRRDVNLSVDEVWCVFDVDDHPNLDEAKQQARDNGINLAISNPSFELWLVLHFQNQNAFITRQNVRAICQQSLAGYNKEVSQEMYELLAQHYDEAVQRSDALQAMHKSNMSPEHANPSTGVFRLTERIRDLSKAKHIADVSRKGRLARESQ